MEPSQQDVAAVQAAIGEQPAPQQQPEPTTPQPTPSQQPAAQQSQPAQQTNEDPFTQFIGQNQPAQQPPAEPQPAAQQQPTEQPSEPTPQQPVQQPAQQPATKTYQDYLDESLRDVPKVSDSPDASKVNPDDPESVKAFFDDLMNTATSRAEANFAKKQAVQNLENRLWNEAFEEYASLKDNKNLRDTVQAIRMAEFNKGNAITPKQAAKQLLNSLQQQYQRGVADNQVQTRIEQVQPTGGGSTQVTTSASQQDVLEAVQTGGEDALVEILARQYKV